MKDRVYSHARREFEFQSDLAFAYNLQDLKGAEAFVI
jgi:hypothetical protein